MLASARVNAEVTVYGQVPLGQISSSLAAAASATQTGPNPALTTLPAYDETILIPPPVPSPAPPRQFTVEMQRDAANVNGLSIPHRGAAFFGFSIEMSVVNQVRDSLIQVPFLNLMANLVERAGEVLIRMGGNTQEQAGLVDSIDGYRVISKEALGHDTTTRTPGVIYTMDLFYLAANISSLVNVKWFMGIPFNDTTNWRTQVAEYGQNILGDHLVGLQAGNEPDLYINNGHRTGTYTPNDYVSEVQSLITSMNSNPNIPNKSMLIGPNLEGNWSPESVWDAGFLTACSENLYALSVEHYPTNNCFAQFGVGTQRFPQEEFPLYLNHNAGRNLIAPYLNSTQIAQQVEKPFIMFETNTASCGGFPGISDSYGAALWALDYGFTMAYSNFSNALLHIGGQTVYYNPFTAPPTNQSTYRQWTIGSIYYSTLVIAEAFGKSNTSRIIDMDSNDGNIYTPAYAIYENDVLTKAALFNFVDDRSGASDLQVSLSVPGAGVPASVRVKYLLSESVSFNNITWAGQTFGGQFDVDGRLRGDLNVTTINCDQAANTCVVPVPAPGFALVFFGNDDDLALGQSPLTFATTARTKTVNTVTVDPSLLATSNGHSGTDRDQWDMGSTSKGSIPNTAATMQKIIPGLVVALSAAIGWSLVMG
ncbi:glycoside hydrolase family 79 protein [Cyathus striatus]|nr:glycoside hydrolase family 79 protein [Cyathus striatus]